MRPTRIGVMGFGQIGRQVFLASLDDPRSEVVAVSDVGEADILHHLLARSTTPRTVAGAVALEGNYLVARRGGKTTKARLLRAEKPSEVPWDVLGADVVVDATGRFRSREQIAPHLGNGAKRVLLSSLPSAEDAVDRVAIYGVNHREARAEDAIVSAGSASTAATAMALQVVTNAREIAHATVTSVHAYTSDQSLQDHVGADYRRSRSGAENIIPNDTPAVRWAARVLPALAGKVSGFAMNVPVPAGSLLDLTISFREGGEGLEATTVNEWFEAAAAAHPALIGVTADPIVSSDVKGVGQSLLVDLQGTQRAGEKLVKLLAWHETLGHAMRILDLIACYAELDAAAAAPPAKATQTAGGA